METEPYLHLSPASTGMTRDFLRVNHTPPSGRTCLTWEVSGLAHTQRNCGWVLSVCVCVCVYLYSTDYLIGVSWKSCGITHLCNVRTSVCQSGPRTPAANIIFTRLSEMVQVWITISLPSPRSSRNSPCTWVRIPAHLISASNPL